MSSGTSLAGQFNTINGVNVSGDAASYKFNLQQNLKILIPNFNPSKNSEKNPIQLDGEEKAKKEDVPKVPEIPAGRLNLGQNLINKIAPGEDRVAEQSFTLNWLLRGDETIQSIICEHHITKEEVVAMVEAGPEEVDLIYLIKWGNLSYGECTWEPSSLIRKKDKTESKLKDFERFNRSLDHNSRQKMTGFIYAHKQILKIYQKKAAVGKKIDHRSHEEIQTREMLSKLLKFEAKSMPNGYFQYDFAKKLVP